MRKENKNITIIKITAEKLSILLNLPVITSCFNLQYKCIQYAHNHFSAFFFSTPPHPRRGEGGGGFLRVLCFSREVYFVLDSKVLWANELGKALYKC